ncbi:MAG TPA: hypothetical protein VER96_39925, partial [Polyangiaceae bacterium]|nr:hypothetical protein [Polyangiaceae bacterium]
GHFGQRTLQPSRSSRSFDVERHDTQPFAPDKAQIPEKMCSARAAFVGTSAPTTAKGKSSHFRLRAESRFAPGSPRAGARGLQSRYFKCSTV